MDGEESLSGGGSHIGQVVRVDNTVRRTRGAGAALVESFLQYLERVGFDAAPRFCGLDDLGRQVLTYIDGEATPVPSWLLDEDANQAHLVSVARMLRRLHDAGQGFVAPAGATPRRPCPATGTTWLHGDVHYGNLVFAGEQPVALIDWDFVMPGDALYDVVTLLFSSRCPRPDLPDEFHSRSASARRTLSAVLDGYGADDDQRRRASDVAAVMFDGAADYLTSLGVQGAGASSVAEFEEEIVRRRFLAGWWREQSST